MRGLGTIANVAAVIVGGLLGLLLKNGLKQRFQDILMKALGLCTMFLGISGALTGLLEISDGKLATAGTAVLIASIVGGALIGEWINIDRGLERFGQWLRRRAKSENDAGFMDGFVNASLVVCVGAMAIVGSVEDGLKGDASMLYVKSVLDCVIVLVFASTYGKGAIFSAIPVGLLQGSVTLLAGIVAPILGQAVISGLSFVGSALIFCVGVNLVFGNKFKVANMLPALVIAGAMAGFMG
ncbi:MAG TPA: DUF554 domain-containing protein [Clostridia bacterium]|nr:DUF554 domain-containing protein [Clostridia bacterium]